MTFQSPQFFVFFPCVFFLYFASPPRFRNSILLVASAVFYMAWRPEYILLILYLVTVDYFVALGLVRTSGSRRKILLGFSLCSNLGLLFFYKYFAFAANALRLLAGALHLHLEPPAWEILLPVGISFHTFQALSYTIDVYRGETLPERNFFRLSLYVLFFPQLVAGPIERSSNLLPQFREVHEFDYEATASGLRLALWGLVKKVVIADRLALLSEPIYADPTHYTGLALLAATYAFAFQIYADFSAYSDIAIGVARALGFRLMKNFDRPYFARSPIEFWRRWHISLSTWFRDYVYIPLGGRQGGAGVVFLTFLLSGLWHGAGWTFLIWGAYHGVLVALNRVAGRLTAWRPPPWISGLLTFHLVLVGWVLFRASSAADAFYILGHLTSGVGSLDTFIDRQLNWFLGGLGVLALLVADLGGPALQVRWPTTLRWASYVAGALLILNSRLAFDVPFIYFQF
ncbi:MAG TPA: MBOAT family O-acyltransferase [Planctomycetota bacterium]|nr:MBOAT family O-acyltransferase [Planctomycetota bacterium]